MKLAVLVVSLSMVAAVGCGSKSASDTSSKAANSAPLQPGMSTYLDDVGEAPQPANFNPVMNPGEGITMYAPPGYEWSAPATVVAAFSNVIAMRESAAMTNDSPIHIFYALPDLLSELKYPTTLDARVYTPISYEEYLGKVKTSKTKWNEAGSVRTAMGLVPVFEREEDGMERYSMGEPKRFKVVIRQYGLCWKSQCVVVTTITPEPMDGRPRSGLEQAIGTIRLIPKRNGQLILPPEGPKAAEYGIKGADARERYRFGTQPRDPIDEMNRVNEFNRQNQLRSEQQPGTQPDTQPQPDPNAPPSSPPGPTDPPAQDPSSGSGQPGTGGGQ